MSPGFLGLHSTAGPFDRAVSIRESDFGRRLDDFLWASASNEDQDYRKLFKLEGCDRLYNGFESPAYAGPSLIKEAAARIQRWASYPDKPPKPKSIHRHQAQAAPPAWTLTPPSLMFDLPPERDDLSQALDYYMTGRMSFKDYGSIKKTWWRANPPALLDCWSKPTLKRSRNEYNSDTDGQRQATRQRVASPSASTVDQPGSPTQSGSSTQLGSPIQPDSPINTLYARPIPVPRRTRGKTSQDKSAPFPQLAESVHQHQVFYTPAPSHPPHQGGKGLPQYRGAKSGQPLSFGDEDDNEDDAYIEADYEAYDEADHEADPDDEDSNGEDDGDEDDDTPPPPPSSKRARQPKAQPKAAKPEVAKPKVAKKKAENGRKGAWTNGEYQTLYETLKSFQEHENAIGKTKDTRLKDEPLWQEMERRIARHPTQPVHRTSGACKNFWSRHGRVRDKWDEKLGGYNPNAKGTSVQKPKSKGESSKQKGESSKKKKSAQRKQEEYDEDEEDAEYQVDE